VSVVIPVYNAGDYLVECLDSLVRQDLPPDKFEVIAVDDGSTDGSGLVLDTYATKYGNFHVIHQPNSGWPGRPRNVGTDAARGEFLFYMDADDYVGPETLRRTYDFAVRHSSDVVVVKLVSIGGRWQGYAAWKDTQVDADLDRALLTFTPQKLFRRAFLQAHGIRFDEGKVRLEDGMFVTEAYLRASRVSILADYDYYFLRQRADGANISSQRLEPAAYIASVTRIVELILNLHPDPDAAIRLALGVYRRKALKVFRPERFLAYDAERRAGWVRAVKALADDYLPQRYDAELRHPFRLRSHVARLGDPAAMALLAELELDKGIRATVDNGVVTIGLPEGLGGGFMDVTHNIAAEACLERVSVTGSTFEVLVLARFVALPSEVFDAAVTLRRRGSDEEVRAVCEALGERHGWHAFKAAIPHSRLAGQSTVLWDAWIVVPLSGAEARARISVDSGMTGPAPGSVGPQHAINHGQSRQWAYVTERGNVSIRSEPRR
jgi:glycosyltransferase involved in cell wall biosynthesis